MCPISSSARPNSSGKTSGETGDIADAFTGKDYYQNLIKNSNSVPLYKIFKYYGLRLDEINKKSVCPFKSHKGGRENSASFYYYPDTNSFWCFGCKTGVFCCDFVAAMDSINRVNAASKILELFSGDVDPDFILNDERQNFSEKLEIMLDFSKTVRDFLNTHLEPKAIVFVEETCKVYDNMNEKHKLNNEALKSMTKQLKDKILSYK